MTYVPSYDALPRFGEDLPVRHAWDFWGPQSRLGTLSWLTDERKQFALRVPRQGKCINLSLPLTEPSPPPAGRRPAEHTVFERDRNIVEDRLDYLDLQGSSQWDGLRHVRARQYGLFNQAALSDDAELGIDRWVRHGIVARGVLVDLPVYWQSIKRVVDPLRCARIEVADLRAALELQDSRIGEGDVLLVRTGWMSSFRSVAASRISPIESIGLAATEEMAAFLWDTHLAAVVTDNPAVEALPADPGGGFLHRLLIPSLGMPLGELWDLEELANDAASTSHYDCCLVSVPLNLPGAVGSPANALAIV